MGAKESIRAVNELEPEPPGNLLVPRALDDLAERVVSTNRQVVAGMIGISRRIINAGLYGADTIGYLNNGEWQSQVQLARYAGDQSMHGVVVIGIPEEASKQQRAQAAKEDAAILSDNHWLDSGGIYGVAKLRIPERPEADMTRLEHSRADTAQFYKLGDQTRAMVDVLKKDHGLNPLVLPQTMVLRSKRGGYDAPDASFLIGGAFFDLEERLEQIGINPSRNTPMRLMVMATIERGVYRLDKVARRAKNNVLTRLKSSKTSVSQTAADAIIRTEDKIPRGRLKQSGSHPQPNTQDGRAQNELVGVDR